jgi:hypothetical protein
MSRWSHLPNAKYIDRIIDHVTANPKAWDAAVRDAAVRDAAYNAAVYAVRDAAYNAAYNAAAVYAARDAVRDAAWIAVRDAVRDAAWIAVRDAAWITVRDALLALVAWDYAGDLMDSPAEQVKVLAILGDQAALLMYTAIAAMETTQELV